LIEPAYHARERRYDPAVDRHGHELHQPGSPEPRVRLVYQGVMPGAVGAPADDVIWRLNRHAAYTADARFACVLLLLHTGCHLFLLSVASTLNGLPALAGIFT